MSATQIAHVSHRHEAIIDFLLAMPGEKNLQTLCDRLHVSRSWLSIVMNSDAFRAEYERRRGEYNQQLANTVQIKMYHAAEEALDRVIEGLGADDVDPRFALDVLDKTTNRLGFGPSKGNAPLVEVHMHAVDQALLANARQAMRSVNLATEGRSTETLAAEGGRQAVLTLEQANEVRWRGDGDSPESN
jgi:hypothetical protein